MRELVNAAGRRWRADGGQGDQLQDRYRIGASARRLWPLLRLRGEPPLTRFLAEQLCTPHWYSMEPARRDFGYVPQVSIEEGLRRLGFICRIDRHHWLHTAGGRMDPRHQSHPRSAMLHYAIIFFVIAIIAAVLGFSGIAGAATNIAWILFVVFLILAVISMFRKRGSRRCPLAAPGPQSAMLGSAGESRAAGLERRFGHVALQRQFDQARDQRGVVQPAGPHSFGYMLMRVKPGSVLTSLMTISPSAVRNTSTRAMPAHPAPGRPAARSADARARHVDIRRHHHLGAVALMYLVS
jgi:uncharacterized membrane protein YtjA (UPF0391 family)